MKTIEGIISYPLDCETSLGSIFAALFTSLQKDIPDEMEICNTPNRRTGALGDLCTKCGNCIGRTKKNSVYGKLTNEYAFVSGQPMLQYDMSDDGFSERDEMETLDGFGDTIDFVLGYAGYEHTTFNSKTDKETIYNRIRASIDDEVPVLMQYSLKSLWVLITGYGENMVLYGHDGGSRVNYYETIDHSPDFYDNKLFCSSNWYENMKRTVIIGEKCEPSVTMDDVIKRNEKIMRPVFENNYYQKAMDYIRNNGHFTADTENLKNQAKRISDFISLAINGRSIIGWFAQEQLDLCDEKHRKLFEKIIEYHGEIHDICWVVWRGVGTYEDAYDQIIQRLVDPFYRKLLADVIEIIGNKDRKIYECLVIYVKDNTD